LYLFIESLSICPLVARASQVGHRAIRLCDSCFLAFAQSSMWIDPLHLPHVFDRFYKADSARSGAGSGLGLAIARENALLLGGDVVVRSEAGAGTEFELRLPVTRPLRGSEAGAVERADSEDLHRTEGSPP
jgi:K+-sensing histidine kinase KdpD